MSRVHSRRRGLLATVAVFAALAIPGSAVAAPPERITENYTVMFPDTERGVVVLINTTRADFCTAEMIAWEEAMIEWVEWLESGGAGPEPVVPDIVFPDGRAPIKSTLISTGQGALVRHVDGKGLVGEVWEMVDDAPLVGPCTDTEPGGLLLSGLATLQGNDNDLFATGTRGNSYGDSGSIKGKGPDGRPHSYTWRFHTNSECYAPEEEEPRCLVQTSDFR